MRISWLAGVFLSVSVVSFLPLASAANYAGKRILYIDSYHVGNEWNDGIARGIENVLDGTGVVHKRYVMDTKRNRSEEFKQKAARLAKREIEAFQPDVVIVSDDNASKYLVKQFYKDDKIPFVFCGLNWDASVYGFPYTNVTGMVEVSPIPQMLRLLGQYAKGKRIGFLTEDSPTKHKEIAYHKIIFDQIYAKGYFVKTYEEWQEAYIRLQDEVDMVVLLGVGGVKNWSHEKAREVALKFTRIPSATDFPWFMSFTMLGVTKSPDEQGQWSAHAALRILDGVKPMQIPLSYNREGKLYFNRTLAERLGIADIPAGAEVVN